MRSWTWLGFTALILCCTFVVAAQSTSNKASDAFGDLSLEIVASNSENEDFSGSEVGKVKYPGSLSSVIDANGKQYLHIRAKLDFKRTAQQFFLQLISSKNAVTQFVLVQKDNYYRVKIHLSSSPVVEALSGAGEYRLKVVVGHPSVEKGIQWNFGSVSLSIAAPPSPPKPFEIPQEIQHAHRPPESRPFSIIALAFTGATIVPLFALFALLKQAGLNISFPLSDVSYLFWATIFHATLACFLLLFALYWFGLNIFQALVAIALLSLVLIFSGNRALDHHHSKSQNSSTSKAKQQ